MLFVSSVSARYIAMCMVLVQISLLFYTCVDNIFNRSNVGRLDGVILFYKIISFLPLGHVLFCSNGVFFFENHVVLTL